MSYEESVDFLLNIPLYGKKAGLKNTQQLLERLGHPEAGIPIIHVAGTNGKGSVSAMLSGIYVKHGMKVGLFTSPHLEKINERIRINNEPISDSCVQELASRLRCIIEEETAEGRNHPTFFETMLLMALLVFKEKGVDLIILETGIGGRLDPTNGIDNTLVSVITQIDFDHTDILGHTLQEIASEKAGIIKNQGVVVLQDNQPEVLRTIEAECEKKGAELFLAPLENVTILKSSHMGIDFSVDSKYYKYDRIRLNTGALYQVRNAATALMVVEACRTVMDVNPSTVVAALADFYWPGRMEQIDNRLLLDGAHNPGGMAAFVQSLKTEFKGRRIRLLMASMKDKDCSQMVAQLKQVPWIEQITVTQVHGERCMQPEAMAALLREAGFENVAVETDLKAALRQSVSPSGEWLLCCAGSLYLIGDIKSLMRGGIIDDQF